MKTFSLFLILSLVFAQICVYGQATEIIGRVTNPDNNGISNVHILVEETEFTTSTDKNGNFNIHSNSFDSLTLIFTHIGYIPQRIKAKPGHENLIIILQSDNYNLDVFTITEDHKQKTILNNSVNMSIIDATFIETNMSSNLMNSLEKIPGIQASNVGPSMSRPLIRGNSGYRIVIAKNNIKQEEQYWNMHQGIAIDQYSVEEVEIIKGPASLSYGSDAMGGVINIKNTSIPSVEGVDGLIVLTGKTNNDWLGMNAKLNLRKNSKYLKISVSHHEFADYRIPADSFEYKPMHYAPLFRNLVNTAGKETNVNFQTGIVKKNFCSSLIMSYYRDHSGFFAFSAGQELINADTAIHNLSKRDILLPSIKVENFDIQHNTNIFRNQHKYNISIAMQHNISNEFDYIEDITGYRTEDVEKYSKNNLDLQYALSTYSGRLSYIYNDTGTYSLNIGVAGLFQQNKTDGFSHLIPEYERYTTGIYTDHKYRINKKWMIQAGLRADYHTYSITETLNPNPHIGESVFNNAINPVFTGISYALGVVYFNLSDFSGKLHLGKSYRTPSVYELSSYGIHRHNLRFEKGCENLDPDEAYQADAVLEYKKKNMTIAVSPFLCFFTNYIYLTPTPEFALGTFTGQIYEYRQNSSLQYGSEFSLHYQLPYNMNFSGTFEYLYAMNYDTRLALPYTPPFSAIPEVFYYNASKNFRIGVEAVWVAEQKLTAINEQATPSYTIFNLRAGKSFTVGKQEISLFISVQNITDKKYLNHLSYYRRLQIPEPGRNIQVSLKVPLKNKKTIL